MSTKWKWSRGVRGKWIKKKKWVKEIRIPDRHLRCGLSASEDVSAHFSFASPRSFFLFSLPLPYPLSCPQVPVRGSFIVLISHPACNSFSVVSRDLAVQSKDKTRCLARALRTNVCYGFLHSSWMMEKGCEGGLGSCLGCLVKIVRYVLYT